MNFGPDRTRFSRFIVFCMFYFDLAIGPHPLTFLENLSDQLAVLFQPHDVKYADGTRH